MEPHPTDWRHSHQFQTYEQQEYERQQMNSMQLSWNNQLVHPVMQQNNQIYPALTSQVSVHAQAYPHQDYNSGLNNELAQQDQTLVVPQNNFSSTGNSSAYLGTDYLDQQPAFNTEQQAPQNMAQGNQSAILYNGYSSNSAQPMNMSPIPHINEGRNFGSWNQSQPYEQANTTVHKSSSSGNILPQAHQIHHGCEMLRQPLKPQCSEASMSGLPSTFLFGAQNVIQARPRVVRNSSYSDTSSAPPVNTAFVQHTMPAASQPALSAHTDPTTLGEGWNASVGYSFGTPMQYSGHNHNASGPSHGNMQPHLLQSGLPQSTGSSLQSHSSDSTASNSLNTGSTVSVHAEARRGSLFTQPMHHESSTTLAHNLKRRPSRQTESLDDNLTSRSVSSSIPSTPDLSRQQSRSSIRSPSTEYSQVQGSFPPPTDGQTLAVDSLQIDGDDQPIPDLTAVHLEEKTSALNTWARLPPRPKNDDEANAKLRPQIVNYLQTPNRLLLGERTIIIMSTSVGQKSYGSERRFLMPAPSALLLGASWWTHLPKPYVPEQKERHNVKQVEQIFAPSMKVKMTHGGESGQGKEDKEDKEAFFEWLSHDGDVFNEDIASAQTLPIAGRVVGKDLYISDVKEDHGDKMEKEKQTARALISVISPGLGSEKDRTIGNFLSRPVKIISKPSKKAQNSKKGNQYILHGSTVSLFNRLRSQTVSTRFLCVSGPGSRFPVSDWTAMTGEAEKPFDQKDKPACAFESRTSSWDAFVIYAVDPCRPWTAESDRPHSQPGGFGHLEVPYNALPIPPGGESLPIHYNQPIILQCVTSGVLSPIMIIRKVERGSIACGGGLVDAGSVRPIFDLPSAPGEPLGEPVSQMHKIALEAIPDPELAYSTPVHPETGFVGGGSYMACVIDQVGHRRAISNRMPATQDQHNATNAALLTDDQGDSWPAIAGDDTIRDRSQSLAAETAELPSIPTVTNDGGKVKKLRRATSSLSNPISRSAASGRRRGLSSGGSTLPAAVNGTASRGMWVQDAGDSAVWTIASIEMARHTFYIPPDLFDGLIPYRCKAVGIPNCLMTPIPAVPLSNMPIVRKHLVTKIDPHSSQARRMTSPTGESRLVTLYGENLGPEWTVWFGDVVSPYRAESPCSEVLECIAPVPDDLLPGEPRHILLVRTDGIIVPSNMYFIP